MIIKIKRKLLKKIEIFAAVAALLSYIFLGLLISSENVMGTNVTNSTVLAKVNVTNNAPSLYKVVITPSPIDLNANGAAVVTCNGSFSDYNGYDTLGNISATFYQSSVNPNAADDNNTHYSNITCGSCQAVPGTGNQNGSCLCQFAVQYYANPGTWQCNMTINDSGGLISSYNSSVYTVTEVLGIRTESQVLDYGNLSVTQVSPYTRMNVSNGGNIPINITLRGFGSDDEEIGRNYTMLCESGMNISFGYQRYYPGNGTAFNEMYNLTNQSRQFNLTLPKRFNNTKLMNDTNATFWKLEIPAQSSGVCNGTIIFGAIDASE